MAADRLDTLRNELLGTNWKCMNPLGREREGSVVQINDVAQKGNQFFVSFDTGSKVGIDMMRDHFIRAEDAIGMGGSEQAFDKINEFDPYAGITAAAPSQFMPSSVPAAGSMSMPAPPPGTSLLDMPIPKGGPINIQAMMGENFTPTIPVAKVIAPIPKAESIFKMFDTKKKELPVSIELDFPDIQLLKMMYKNAADKGKFMNELSTYIYSNINKDAVTEAMTKMIVGTQKTKGSNDSRIQDQEPSNG